MGHVSKYCKGRMSENLWFFEKNLWLGSFWLKRLGLERFLFGVRVVVFFNYFLLRSFVALYRG